MNQTILAMIVTWLWGFFLGLVIGCTIFTDWLMKRAKRDSEEALKRARDASSI